MPKARNRFQRSKQIHQWLQAGWKTGRRVELIWVSEIIDGDQQCWGQTYRDGRGLVIEISKRKNRTWTDTSATQIHEWVHCVLWGPASIENSCDHHPVQFYALEGEIRNAWDHDHGAEQATEYDFD